MPQFPKQKNEIFILAAKIADGITQNPADYPNPPFDPGPLNILVGQVIAQISDRQDKEAEAKAALDLENNTVDDIVEEAKRLLREAENAHGQDAAKLQEIGWDVRADPKSLAPGEVRNLEATHQGAGTVELDWKSPARTATTGRPTAYKITRETRAIDTHEPIEEFGAWESVTFESKAVLMNQPRGVEISYRVTASNVNGDGPPVEAQRVVL